MLKGFMNIFCAFGLHDYETTVKTTVEVTWSYLCGFLGESNESALLVIEECRCCHKAQAFIKSFESKRKIDIDVAKQILGGRYDDLKNKKIGNTNV